MFLQIKRVMPKERKRIFKPSIYIYLFVISILFSRLMFRQNITQSFSRSVISYTDCWKVGYLHNFFFQVSRWVLHGAASLRTFFVSQWDDVSVTGRARGWTNPSRYRGRWSRGARGQSVCISRQRKHRLLPRETKRNPTINIVNWR